MKEARQPAGSLTADRSLPEPSEPAAARATRSNRRCWKRGPGTLTGMPEQPLPHSYVSPPNPNRTMRISSLGRTIAAGAIATLAACATPGGRATGPTVPIDLQVNNNLRLPADLSVYAVSQGGNRMLLGDVPPGKNRTLRFKPVAFSEPYRLLAILPNGHQVHSQSFIVGSDMTGGIVWTLVPNIIGFIEVDSDSTAAP